MTDEALIIAASEAIAAEHGPHRALGHLQTLLAIALEKRANHKWVRQRLAELAHNHHPSAGRPAAAPATPRGKEIA